MVEQLEVWSGVFLLLINISAVPIRVPVNYSKRDSFTNLHPQWFYLINWWVEILLDGWKFNRLKQNYNQIGHYLKWQSRIQGASSWILLIIYLFICTSCSSEPRLFHDTILYNQGYPIPAPTLHSLFLSFLNIKYLGCFTPQLPSPWNHVPTVALQPICRFVPLVCLFCYKCFMHSDTIPLILSC